MNKKDLIALGIEDEDVVQKIIVLHGKDIEKLKSDNTKISEDLQGLQGQLEEANKTIEGFKELDIEGVKKSADEWKQKAEQAKLEADKQISELKFNTALDSSLSAAKAKNVKAVKALLKTEDLKLDDDGVLLGITEQLEKIKSENDFLFESEEETPEIVSSTKTDGVLGDKVINAAREAAGLDASE